MADRGKLVVLQGGREAQADACSDCAHLSIRMARYGDYEHVQCRAFGGCADPILLRQVYVLRCPAFRARPTRPLPVPRAGWLRRAWWWLRQWIW